MQQVEILQKKLNALPLLQYAEDVRRNLEIETFQEFLQYVIGNLPIVRSVCPLKIQIQIHIHGILKNIKKYIRQYIVDKLFHY